MITRLQTWLFVYSGVSRRFKVHLLLATLAAFALRLFFIFKFPATTDDSVIYSELAQNWLHHGVYGLAVGGRLAPLMLRLPGYPGFLAAVFAAFGHSMRAVMLVQALLDVATCFLTAALAARFLCLWPVARGSWNADRSDSSHDSQATSHRPFLVALWLAALCPFTASYTAAILTETLATFLGTLALLLLLEAFLTSSGARRMRPGSNSPPAALTGTRQGRHSPLDWMLAGVVTGLATLVRPEMPLLLAGAGAGLAVAWRRPRDWPKLGLAGAWLALGLVLPLLPWAARNLHTFGQLGYRAPRYAESPGEYVPKGFYQWTHTWLTRFPDVYDTVWKIDDGEVQLESFPPSAFDNPREQARVAQLLEQYNEDAKITAAIDSGFAELARERTARHPLRTYLWVPLGRAASMWFWPRIELTSYSGKIFPLETEWDEDREDLLVTLGFGLLGLAYGGLAVFGLWKAQQYPAVWIAAAYVVVRTAFLTHVETPEPRYVLEAYPIILALAALALSRRTSAFPGK